MTVESVTPKRAVSREVLRNHFSQVVGVPLSIIDRRLSPQMLNRHSPPKRPGKFAKVVLQCLEAQHMPDQQGAIGRGQKVRDGAPIGRNAMRADNGPDEPIEPRAGVTQPQQVTGFRLGVPVHGHHAVPRVARHRKGSRVAPDAVSGNGPNPGRAEMPDALRDVFIRIAKRRADGRASSFGDVNENHCAFIDMAYQHTGAV